MSEAIITTHKVRASPEKRAVEVFASLDAGEVIPGMFIHIPLNGMLDFTVRVREVSQLDGNRVRLVLDCGEDGDDAELVMAFNFGNETLLVQETEEI